MMRASSSKCWSSGAFVVVAIALCGVESGWVAQHAQKRS